MRGRPLRFLAVVVVGWATARAVILWPDPVPLRTGRGDPQRTRAERPRLAKSVEPTQRLAPVASASVVRPRPDLRLATTFQRRIPAAVERFLVQGPAPVTRTEARRRAVDPDRVLLAALSFPGGYRIALPDPVGFPGPDPRQRSRWSGSVWLIVRDGGARALFSPLLGGSQGGARIAYRLDESGRVAMFGRIAGPLGGGSADLAIGLQVRPGRAPVTLYAEARRDRGSVAPAAGLFGGGSAALPGNWRLDGYGQAGVILRHRLVGYADGQARAVRPLAGLEAGGGLWGAVQPNAARLDVGPTLSAPIDAGPARLRLSLDWRHRVAGNARPASGPVLSLGADF